MIAIFILLILWNIGVVGIVIRQHQSIKKEWSRLESQFATSIKETIQSSRKIGVIEIVIRQPEYSVKCKRKIRTPVSIESPASGPKPEFPTIL